MPPIARSRNLGGEIGADGSVHERSGDLVDPRPQVLGVAEARGFRRGAVQRRDLVRQPLDDRERQRSALAQAVQFPAAVEAAHLDQPFDRRARPAEPQPAVAADHRGDADIDVLRRPVDLELPAAALLAPVQGGEVEIVGAQGALQLPGPVARQEDARDVRVHPLHRGAAVGRGLRQERDHLPLAGLGGLAFACSGGSSLLHSALSVTARPRTRLRPYRATQSRH